MSNQLNNKYRLDPDVPYKAYSGANIQATIGNRVVGSLQACTVSVTREVAALYGFGSADAKAVVKGKRGIAGSLVFTQFDRDALLFDVFQGAYQQPLAADHPFFSSRFANLDRTDGLLAGKSLATRNFSTLSNADINQNFGSEINGELLSHLKDIYGLVGQQKLRYADQIPEFDITLTMVNEEGNASFCVIGAVTLVNQGFGFSVDDLTSEVAYTYVARYLTPLTSITQATHFRPSGR